MVFVTLLYPSFLQFNFSSGISLLSAIVDMPENVHF